jgi:hypothetical protein
VSTAALAVASAVQQYMLHKALQDTRYLLLMWPCHIYKTAAASAWLWPFAHPQAVVSSQSAAAAASNHVIAN